MPVAYGFENMKNQGEKSKRNMKGKKIKIKLFNKKKSVNTDEVITNLQSSYSKVNLIINIFCQNILVFIFIFILSEGTLYLNLGICML